MDFSIDVQPHRQKIIQKVGTKQISQLKHKHKGCCGISKQRCVTPSTLTPQTTSTTNPQLPKTANTLDQDLRDS